MPQGFPQHTAIRLNAIRRAAQSAPKRRPASIPQNGRSAYDTLSYAGWGRSRITSRHPRPHTGSAVHASHIPFSKALPKATCLHLWSFAHKRGVSRGSRRRTAPEPPYWTVASHETLSRFFSRLGQRIAESCSSQAQCTPLERVRKRKAGRTGGRPPKRNGIPL